MIIQRQTGVDWFLRPEQISVTLLKPSLTVELPYRGETPIGGTPLYTKQLGVFLKIFNILGKKGEINFKIGGIG
jgi:hypothetical protein